MADVLDIGATDIIATKRVAVSADRAVAAGVEWPTVVLAAVIYGGWFALTAWGAVLPWWVLVVAGGWLIAWHGSLQHEVIHGHPTASRWINSALGFPPLALWLPYAVYAREHIAHHTTPHLTDPHDDTESNYLPREGGIAHTLAAVEATLIGRMVLGPPIRAMAFWLSEARRAGREPLAVARDWVPHLIGVALIVLWLQHVGFSIMTYVVCIVWPGKALSLLRSYAEHRASPDPAARTALVTDFGLLSLLFLNNNLHVWHHARPELPWYALPALYRARPDAFPKAPRYRNYRAVFARHAVRRHDLLVHPSPTQPGA